MQLTESVVLKSYQMFHFQFQELNFFVDSYCKQNKIINAFLTNSTMLFKYSSLRVMFRKKYPSLSVAA